MPVDRTLDSIAEQTWLKQEAGAPRGCTHEQHMHQTGSAKPVLDRQPAAGRLKPAHI